MFSQQSITFGKIEKLIKCEKIDMPKSDSVIERSEDSACSAAEHMIVGTVQYESDDVHVDDSSLDTREVNASYENDNLDNELSSSELENIRENVETATIAEPSDDNGFKRRTESESPTHSPSSGKYQEFEKNQLCKRKEESGHGENIVVEGNRDKSSKKKLHVKDKQVKVPELNIPGSAKR